MAERIGMSRKNFIQLLTRILLSLAGLLGINGLVRYLSYREPPKPPEQIPIGTLNDFPDGSQTLRLEIPAAITRSGDQVQAVNLTCTHLGCLVEPDGGDFLCPCHGSRFSPQGEMMRGPAEKDLLKFKVEFDEGGQIILVENDGES